MMDGRSGVSMPLPITVMVLLLSASAVFVLTGVLTQPTRNQLTLSDNTTRLLTDIDAWTDIAWSQQWTASASWQYFGPGAAPNESTFMNLHGGRFDLYFALYPVVGSVDAACASECLSCGSDGDCCQLPGLQYCVHVVPNPCREGPVGTEICVPYQNVGGNCTSAGFQCLPNLTCNAGVCQAPPTPAPTAAPTNVPTAAPTATPTNAPTKSPTATPTNTPTQAPSGSPTVAPTQAPSGSPTAAPTKAPTQAPTQSPTTAPTAAPTNAPTQSPTAAPTTAPTTAPTAAPTAPPCPPVPSISTRLVVQQGADPAFYQVSAVHTQQVDASTDMLLTVVTGLTAHPGDVYKFQWLSDCATMTLSPAPVDLGLLGVAGQGVQSISASLLIADSDAS